MKLLIIDDEYLARASLRTQLEALGEYQILEAESAMKALGILGEENPEVIFIDIQMPEMSGIQFMEQARKISQQSIFVVLSGYNLFEYAQKAIEYDTYKYLLKPISDGQLAKLMQDIEGQVWTRMKEKMQYEELYLSDKKRERILKRKYVYELLTATETKRDRILQILKDNGVVFQASYFQVVLFYIGQISPADEELMKFGIANIAEEIWNGQGRVVSFFDEEWEMGILLNSESVMETIEFCNLMEHMHKAIQQFIAVLDVKEITIGVGENRAGMGELENAYDSAKQALDMYLIEGTNKIYYAGERGGESKFSKQYWEKRFEKELLLKNQDGLNKCIEELYEKYLSGSLTNIKELHKLHLSLFVLLRKTVEELETETGELEEDEFLLYKKIQKLDSMENMKEFLIKKVDDCFQFIQSAAKSGNQKAVQIGKKFIEKNLGNDLTLNAAAEHVNLSAVYFSKIFKEEEGKNFIDYVTERRMNLACEMLKRNAKTAEICDRIGYHDMKHFYKVFKKHMGISPSQYKKKR